MKQNVRLVSPGTLIKDYLHDNGVTQTQLSEMIGYSEKQVSLILNDKSPITKAFANALEIKLPGTSSSFWLRYADKYAEQEAGDAEELKRENFRAWEKRFFLSKLFKKHPEISKLEQIETIKQATGVQNFDDVLVHRYVFAQNIAFLRDESKCGQMNRDFLDIWFNLIVYFDALEGNNEKQCFKGKENLRDLLLNHKGLWKTTNSEQLVANVKFFGKLAGIHVIFCDSAPTAYVRGAAFPREGEIVVVLTNRFKTIEYVVFAFIHELVHILNGDVSTETNKADLIDENSIDESATSGAAKDYFIKPEIYHEFFPYCDGTNIAPKGKELLITASKEQNVSLGMLVTFLQHDKKISYGTLRECIHSFEYSKECRK